ncbi:MAG: Ig domain-containing protein [Clostridiales bacterium]|jgi:hypothetical protein|nr:Ig domain-containing protein [Clostridiales bacterium]
MKKYLRIICVLLCAAVTAAAVAACGGGGDKALTYSGAALAAGRVGAPYEADVAKASGADSVTYALKQGSALPPGLVLSAAGNIGGVPTEEGTVSFKIVASADGYTDAEAQFSIAVSGLDALSYTGGALPAGETGTAYDASVATATGADGIAYALKSGESLPAGLLLSSAGGISGTPTAVGTVSFTVTASADGYASAEAAFSVVVSKPAESDEVVEYMFAAALTDLDRVEGAGSSGNPKGKFMIVKGATGAESGSFVGYMHKTGVTLTYEIQSDRAADGALAISVGGDLVGDLFNLGPDVFEIRVNGTAVSYTPFELTFRLSMSSPIEFELHVLGEIALLEGDNTITCTVLANDWYNGGTGGPDLDCIKITTAAGLTWSPRYDNLEE